MKYLLIDTSTSHVTISIVKDNEILSFYHEEILSDMSSRIIPIIDDQISKLSFSLKDIDKIFIVNGPGSFTGVRVGVTIAKTISWTLNINIIPISSLELMATTQTSKKYLVPMIDARRGNVFAGIYDNSLNEIKPDKLINLKELLSVIDEDYELISYDNIEINNLKKPNLNILKIINKHKNDKGINPHKLTPKYLKLTEAEENRINN